MTSVYLNKKIKKKLDHEGVNISKLVNKLLRNYVEENFQTGIEIKKEKLKAELEELESEKHDLEEQMQKIESKIATIQGRIEEAESVQQEKNRFLDVLQRKKESGEWCEPSDISRYWVEELGEDRETLWEL